MKIFILFTIASLLGFRTSGQVNMNSPEYKVLNLIVNSIDNFKNDPVFRKYSTHQKTNVYYNLKDIAINYITLKHKFRIDSNKKYTIEMKDLQPKNEFRIYNIKDSARLHIAKGDLIISVFQPTYFNGYTYVVAHARNQGSNYGDRISNFVFILNYRMKVVKYFYFKDII